MVPRPSAKVDRSKFDVNQLGDISWLENKIMPILNDNTLFTKEKASAIVDLLILEGIFE